MTPRIAHIPRLSELNGRFVRMSGSIVETVALLSHAHGVVFLCPKCYIERYVAGYQNPKYGVHDVVCWFSNAPAHAYPPARWNAVGRLIEGPRGRKRWRETIDDLTFCPPGQLSVQLADGCRWHGYVRDGRATILASPLEAT